MIRREIAFGCAMSMTPDVAARLSQMAERFQAKLQLECGGKRVLLGSLIGMLSVECRSGTMVAVLAEGEDEQAAADALAAAIAGN